MSKAFKWISRRMSSPFLRVLWRCLDLDQASRISIIVDDQPLWKNFFCSNARSMNDDPTDAISASLKRERNARGWSLADLSERSGVSKAMISKIERGEASPTATVLGKLSGAFGMALSALLALAEKQGERISRRAAQPVWQDPETGYLRRALSPADHGMLESLEIELPPNVRVPYPATAFAFQHQQILVTEGT